MSQETTEHMDIQFSRMKDALCAFIEWHEMDHESEEPCKLQEAFDAAIERAKEVLRDA